MALQNPTRNHRGTETRRLNGRKECKETQRGTAGGKVGIENELQNKKHRSKPPKIVRKNDHPYRLVILNGCETYSAEWANAFGIDYSPNTSTNSLLMHLVQGREPQAFVGWKEGIEVPAIADFTMHNQYALALADLFISWMGGSSIQSCLEDYAEQMDSFDFEFHDSWRISGCFNLTRL